MNNPGSVPQQSSLAKRIRPWLPSRGNIVFTFLVISLLFWAQSAGAFPFIAPSAASTSTIAYQGRLADAAGNPLTATYPMIFRLYASASVGATSLWEEQWTGPSSVRVSDGLFNVMLGSLTPIPQNTITGNGSLWLGITVGTDDEMMPRVQLGTVPYAVQALTIPDSSVTSAKIADGAISTADLANGSVTQAKLGADVSLIPPDGSITTPKLADNSVTAAKIADGNVGTADLSDNSVTASKVADGNIGTADLADWSVTTAKIVDGNVTNADLGDGSVTSAKIADGNVGTADLANGAVTQAKAPFAPQFFRGGTAQQNAKCMFETYVFVLTGGSYHENKNIDISYLGFTQPPLGLAQITGVGYWLGQYPITARFNVDGTTATSVMIDFVNVQGGTVYPGNIRITLLVCGN